MYSLYLRQEGFATFAELSRPKIMQHTINSIGELCLESGRMYKSRKALDFCREDRLLETVSFRTLALRSCQLAGLLHSLSIGPGDRVMILGENCPAWPASAFGIALAGAISVPVPPAFPLERIREIGERAGISAIFITGGTAGLAGGLDPLLPRISLDSPELAPGKLALWANITVSIGGIAKQIPLPYPRQPEALGGDTAVLWPDGTTSSHKELLAQQSLRLFPRDRIIPLCSLAEKGAFTLGVLGAAMGGASTSCVEPTARSIELLRPTVVIGENDFLEDVYREKAAPLARGPLSRCVLTQPLAHYLAGRKFLKALGGNIRFYGIGSGPDLSTETTPFLKYIHLPWGKAALAQS
jgi:hypothetical protein